jgi:hypothetical protein
MARRGLLPINGIAFIWASQRSAERCAGSAAAIAELAGTAVYTRTLKLRCGREQIAVGQISAARFAYARAVTWHHHARWETIRARRAPALAARALKTAQRRLARAGAARGR